VISQSNPLLGKEKLWKRVQRRAPMNNELRQHYFHSPLGSKWEAGVRGHNSTWKWSRTARVGGWVGDMEEKIRKRVLFWARNVPWKSYKKIQGIFGNVFFFCQWIKSLNCCKISRARPLNIYSFLTLVKIAFFGETLLVELWKHVYTNEDWYRDIIFFGAI